MRSKKSYQKQKRRNVTPLLVVTLLSPYLVGFTDDDSSYTEMMFGAGGGQYVYEDCSGYHQQGFADVGVYGGKKFNGPFRVGATAGIGVLKGESAFPLFYPDLALDWKYFSLGTTGIRLGSQNELYLESKWLDQPPLLSGRGLARFGIGGKLDKPFSRFWIGANVLPYTHPGFAAQLEFPWHENKYLFVNGRFGKYGETNYSEYGFSIGMRMVSF